jgi:hypothetical protein
MGHRKSGVALASLMAITLLAASSGERATAAAAPAWFRPKPCVMVRHRLQPPQKGICPGSVVLLRWS